MMLLLMTVVDRSMNSGALEFSDGLPLAWGCWRTDLEGVDDGYVTQRGIKRIVEDLLGIVFAQEIKEKGDCYLDCCELQSKVVKGIANSVIEDGGELLAQEGGRGKWTAVL